MKHKRDLLFLFFFLKHKRHKRTQKRVTKVFIFWNTKSIKVHKNIFFIWNKKGTKEHKRESQKFFYLKYKKHKSSQKIFFIWNKKDTKVHNKDAQKVFYLKHKRHKRTQKESQKFLFFETQKGFAIFLKHKRIQKGFTKGFY